MREPKLRQAFDPARCSRTAERWSLIIFRGQLFFLIKNSSFNSFDMAIAIVLLGIVALLLLITVVRLHAFIAFVLVSIGIGLAVGLGPVEVVTSLKKGMGDTLGDLVLILGLGAMLGKLVAESGAAKSITDQLVGAFGIRYLQMALMLAGFVVGIPMFYSVGFVIMVPLVFTVAATTGLPLLYVGIPMLASLSVTHGFLPPHPAPTDLANKFGADVGLTLLYGIIVAIPAILAAGLIFSRTLKNIPASVPAAFLRSEDQVDQPEPGSAVSMLSALLPVLLIAGARLIQEFIPPDSPLQPWVAFVGDSVIALLISVLVAAVTLGLQQGRSMKNTMNTMVMGVKDITLVLLVIAGAGGLKQILVDSEVDAIIANVLKSASVSPLLLAWGTAAIIRVCVGSATVAGQTTAGIMAGFVAAIDTPPELMVLAVGAGSLMFSHVNDTGFWLFKEYFQVSVRDTFRSWTVMETIVSSVGFLGVWSLDQLL